MQQMISTNTALGAQAPVDGPDVGEEPMLAGSEVEVPALRWSMAVMLAPLLLLVACAAAVAASDARSAAPAVAATTIVTVVWERQLSRLRQYVQFLPLLQRTAPVLAAAGALVGVGAVVALGPAAGMSLESALLIAGAAGLISAFRDLARRRARRRAHVGTSRIAVIGSPGLTDDLGGELRSLGRSDIEVVGWIAPDPEAGVPEGHVRPLGALGSLSRIIATHRIDLLLLSDEAPRMRCFNEVAETCLPTAVRMQELNAFYEHAFGHVAVGRINAAWFQWVMHPRYRAGMPISKRVTDLLIASVVSIVAVPLIAVLALLVRRDGGPAFFSQARVGEHGKEFKIFKLRTLRQDSGPHATWVREHDARVTPIGRVLRRTHLDELPQLLNLFRGDMSVVGPRPEQPDYVRQLERTVPHYSRRNIARPGVTGWAQVKCGYAGSDSGSTWKLSHDLYYLKHRSMSLDLLILVETLRTLVADRQFDNEFRLPVFVAHNEQRPSRPELSVVGVDDAQPFRD